MKQHEAVVCAMENLGGIATLGQLNHEVFKISDCEWNTKTPFASIRRIVQTTKVIYKVKPGLYGLVKYKSLLEKRGIIAETTTTKKSSNEIDFNHSYYQGLLVEIGNMRGYTTYIPPQDKNKQFLNKPLGSISSIKTIYSFSYPEVVARAKTIDVIWFNDRGFPSSLFEIEHSTDIQNSLLKYNDLQDYYSTFYIVGAGIRKGEFEKKLKYSSFKQIKNRVKFVDYELISGMHTKMFELSVYEKL